jgi:signal transduction histidine kinase
VIVRARCQWGMVQISTRSRLVLHPTIILMRRPKSRASDQTNRSKESDVARNHSLGSSSHGCYDASASMHRAPNHERALRGVHLERTASGTDGANMQLTIDFRGFITAGAEAWRAYTGRPEEPRHWTDLLSAAPIEQRLSLARMCGHGLLTHTSFACRTLLYSHDARRHITCVLHVVRLGRDRVWSVTVQECADDFAEARLQTTDLDEARVDYLVQTIVRGLAHRFNNRLHAAAGHADLIAAACSSRPVHDSAKHISRAAREMSETFAELLACTSSLPTTLTTVNAGHCLAAWLKDIRAHAGSTDIRFVRGACPLIMANEELLRDVVFQLVANAGEATRSHGGHVRLKCGATTVDRRQLELARPACNAHAGAYVFMDVEDDGEGIAPELMHVVFDPFFSTRFLGRGLGLPTVLSNLRRMGGVIILDSVPRTWTRARALLPVAAMPLAETRRTRLHARRDPATSPAVRPDRPARLQPT